jgi:type IV secretion system protein VirD4
MKSPFAYFWPSKLVVRISLCWAASCTYLWLVGEVASLLRFQAGSGIEAGNVVMLPVWWAFVPPGQPQMMWPAPVATSSWAWWLALLLVSAVAVYAVALVRSGGKLRLRKVGKKQARARSGVVAADGARWAARRGLKGLLLPRGVREAAGRIPLGFLDTATNKLGPQLQNSLDPRMLASQPDHSLVVIGSVGSGKSAGLLIPHALGDDRDANMVVVSVKSDVLDATVEWRQQLGRTYVYDPTGMSGRPSAKWSPLQLRRDSAGLVLWEDAERMATAIVSQGETGSDADGGLWTGLATEALAPLLYAAASDEKADLSTVLNWVADHANEQVQEQILLALEKLGSPGALRYWKGVMSEHEKSRSSVFMTLRSKLRAFDSEGVLASAIGPDTPATPYLDPDAFVAGSGQTLYLIAPLQDTERLRPVLTGLLGSVISAGMATGHRLPHRLYILIDETANTAAPHNLPEVVSVARALGITVMTIWQDVAQMKRVYPNGYETIMNNSLAKLFLGGGQASLETLNYAKQLGGQAATVRASESEQGRNFGEIAKGRDKSASVAEQSEGLVGDTTLRQLPAGKALLYYGTYDVSALRLNNYYSDPVLLARSEGKASPKLPAVWAAAAAHSSPVVQPAEPVAAPDPVPVLTAPEPYGEPGDDLRLVDDDDPELYDPDTGEYLG